LPTGELATEMTLVGAGSDEAGYRESAGARDGVVASFAPPRARPVVVRVALLSSALFVALMLARKRFAGTLSVEDVLGTFVVAMAYALAGAAFHARSLRATFPQAMTLWQSEGATWARGRDGTRTELGAVWVLAVRPVAQTDGSLFELAFLGEQAELVLARGPAGVMQPALERLARRLALVVDGDVARPLVRAPVSARVPEEPAAELDTASPAPVRRRVPRSKKASPGENGAVS
jgi:hypothetical protein